MSTLLSDPQRLVELVADEMFRELSRSHNGQRRIDQLIEEPEDDDRGPQQREVLHEHRLLDRPHLLILELPVGVHDRGDSDQEADDQDGTEIAPDPNRDHQAAGDDRDAAQRHQQLGGWRSRRPCVLDSLFPAHEVGHHS